MVTQKQESNIVSLNTSLNTSLPGWDKDLIDTSISTNIETNECRPFYYPWTYNCWVWDKDGKKANLNPSTLQRKPECSSLGDSR